MVDIMLKSKYKTFYVEMVDIMLKSKYETFYVEIVDITLLLNYNKILHISLRWNGLILS
jgi:hypothetical protein